jgi:hypothetical protein
MRNLAELMGNKVDKEVQLAAIKYDTIMIEQKPAQLLLGINASGNNRKNELIKNIVINYNKVIGFVSEDLDKKHDEYAEAVLVSEPNAYKEKEVSYFLGVPISQEEQITDNNFVFRNTAAATGYFSFYKGTYADRKKTIESLILKIKKDSLQSGKIYETFIETPQEAQDCILKISIEAKKNNRQNE